MNKKFYVIAILLTGMAALVFSCQKLEPSAPKDEDVLDGPVEGLTYAQIAQHIAGDEAFTGEVFTVATGLGPLFVSNNCSSCHKGDGKGHPFTTLTRFGITDTLTDNNNTPNGPQLQNRAIPGYTPEVMPAGVPFANFTPPVNTGMGFLELVSDDDIIAMAAANANNPDRVRGHPNWNHIPTFVIPEPNARVQNGRYICRFGKKASVYDLLHQTVVAYNQDMSISTTFLPSDTYSHKDVDPEITDKKVRDVVFYLQTLKAPVQRNANDAQVVRGNQVFLTTGCENCHKQTLKTGFSPIEPLSNKNFHPFTDLLVHDMGPGLDDGYTEGTARTAEWRTPPLWGLGLSPASQGGKYFLLHDGRAHSIEDAIMQHGGEATVSRDRYIKLSTEDRNALLQFLRSL
jgi:CxxC motif-containing protein (DUF1111 family)